MYGSLALKHGTLYVAGQDRSARVRLFDLDGRLISPGFRFRDERLGRSIAAGLAVDDDHRLWIADTPSHRVRAFSVFGVAVGGLGVAQDEDLAACHDDDDRRGHLRRPVAVRVDEARDELRIIVASSGRRRHAVRIFGEDGRMDFSLRPEGDPHASFRDVTAMALEGEWLYVAERSGRVQVFHNFDYQFAFVLEIPAFEPTCLASLEDGRLVLCNGGSRPGLFLLNRHGRLLSELATSGSDTGQVRVPGDVVVERHVPDRKRRIALLDSDGERVQIFTLEGRCFGAFSARA